MFFSSSLALLRSVSSPENKSNILMKSFLKKDYLNNKTKEHSRSEKFDKNVHTSGQNSNDSFFISRLPWHCLTSVQNK